MPQRKPIVAFSHPESQETAFSGVKHRAEARRERKRAEAREIEDARVYLGTRTTRPRSPQSVFHFDRTDQVASLVAAREDAPDIGFMARLLALCTLPRTNPGNRLLYKRVNGPYRLYMQAGPENKLPYGNLPRLLLAWVCSEAVRTQRRELVLGASLAAFMRKLGIGSDSGGARGELTRFRYQMDRLFNASIVLQYDGPGETARVGSLVTDQMHLWWDERKPDAPVLWESTIRLGEEFFKEIISHPVPLDLHTLKALKRSSLGLDLYLWLTYRTFTLKAPLQLSWPMLYRQFGAETTTARASVAVDNFRRDCVRELRKIQTAWPDLTYRVARGVVVVYPTLPRITPVEVDSAG